MESKLIPIGADHAGFQLKELLIQHLQSKGYTVKDMGCYSEDSIDYPDFGHPVASMVEENQGMLGILICGSGNGINMTANKHQGIRAGLAWNVEVAKLVRQHNDANVLCLPVRFITLEEAKICLQAFIDTPFEGGRHAVRVGKIACC